MAIISSMIDPARQQLPHHLLPPVPLLGVTFRLVQKADLRPLWENCYPETDWEKFQEHYGYLLNWQENGRCYIVVAETIISNKKNGHELARMNTNYWTDREGESDSASNRNVIIGSGQLIPQAGKAEIAELSVQEPFRNRGIGTAMIQILTRIARHKNLRSVEIGVEAENRGALRLYRRLGFGRERTMRLPAGGEAVILEKSLA